ncbi:hypothetical protein PRIPAC_83999 [Pristionchus pacificus]|uniref:Uncharacterized protein n=1 Tax=Pristionchus pacificus TaxID=54126 RepID=A0A2A6BUT1_PRIPA|nr:hypothetical protein PRIPAC_83999 [Pristionchus pacificus]|eukprot:PDM69659.1 hypothetical protein PRIPAC_44755 [Pristionchus pacificus]
MAFWNFGAPMPLSGCQDAANRDAAPRASGVAAASGAGHGPPMQQLQQHSRGGRGPVPASSSVAGGPARRRRTRQGRLRGKGAGDRGATGRSKEG